ARVASAARVGGGSIRRWAVRREHELDGQVEQRAQPLDDLLAGHALREPLLEDLEPTPAVGEGGPGDSDAAALEVEHDVVRILSPRKGLDPDRQLIAGPEYEPSDRIRLSVRRRNIDRRVEPLRE